MPTDWTWQPEDEHLRSHHFLRHNEPAPACCTHGSCTFERGPRDEHNFWLHDRTAN